MLSSKLLSKATEDSGRRYWFNRFLERVKNGYRAVLKWVLGHRKTTVFGTIAVIVGSLALIPMIGASFIPSRSEERRVGKECRLVWLEYARKQEDTNAVKDLHTIWMAIEGR